MKKFFVLILTLSILGVMYYLLTRGDSQLKIDPENQEFPISSEIIDTNTSEQNPTLSNTTDKRVTSLDVGVSIEEIIARDETIDIGSGSYILAGGNDTVIVPPYQILYYAPDDSYIVSLLELPLNDTRINAEKEFLSILEITKEQACTIPVVVTTPEDVSEKYAGKNLGLSFCLSNELLY